MASQTEKPRTEMFEWQIGEESWQGFTGTAQVSQSLSQSLLSNNERRVVFGTLRLLLFCAAALFLTAGGFHSIRQVEYAQNAAIIENSFAAELAAWQRNDRNLFAETIAPEQVEVWGPTWRKYWRGSTNERQKLAYEIVHIESLELSASTHDNQNSELAQVGGSFISDRFGFAGGSAADTQRRSESEYLFVEVVDWRPARDWWLISPTRETRVYTQASESEERWVRTIPPNSYWGESRRSETANVRFEYHERDAALVAAVAPKLDAHYQRIFDLLALDPLDARIKFTVRIAPHPRQGRGSRSTVVFITTPLLAAKPLKLSDAEYVERYVVQQLTAMAVNRAARWRGSADNLLWSSVMWALRSQIEAELLGSQSSWFVQHEEKFVSYGQGLHPMGLEEITRIRKPKTERDTRHIYWQQIGAELMVRYAIETYGIHATIGMISNFNQSRNWDQLIPKTFELSREEFEAGFAAYVEELYDWPTSATRG